MSIINSGLCPRVPVSGAPGGRCPSKATRRDRQVPGAKWDVSPSRRTRRRLRWETTTATPPSHSGPFSQGLSLWECQRAHSLTEIIIERAQHSGIGTCQINVWLIGGLMERRRGYFIGSGRAFPHTTRCTCLLWKVIGSVFKWWIKKSALMLAGLWRFTLARFIILIIIQQNI